MDNLDQAELIACPKCGEGAEHRFNIYKRNVWACGCWKHDKPVYASHGNHINAINDWNAQINVVGLNDNDAEEIVL